MPSPAAVRDSRVTARAFTLLAGILVVVLGVSFFLSNRGVANLQEARKRVAELHADIDRLKADNAHLRAEIDSVQRSTYAVERIAREDLGMSKPGEVVYILPHRR
ncbi:MAG TPA: septum formation initiator family protein [Thermoanaerobaculia bacterium]|jgi:cell division protein FtsB|nr:septum formation initiator family protein [Thermoanaerobaculia bacterium]